MKDILVLYYLNFFYQVEFQTSENKRNSNKIGVNIKLVSRNKDNIQQGFIATLKDNFGFIELHVSSISAQVLELGLSICNGVNLYIF